MFVSRDKIHILHHKKNLIIFIKRWWLQELFNNITVLFSIY